jgi:hypothetical protein
MKREEVYLQVFSEKTGEPPERLILAYESTGLSPRIIRSSLN